MNSVLSWIFKTYSFYSGRMGVIKGWGGRARGIRYFAETANTFQYVGLPLRHLHLVFSRGVAKGRHCIYFVLWGMLEALHSTIGILVEGLLFSLYMSKYVRVLLAL